MNRRLRTILTYVRTVLPLMILSAIVLYAAGAPIASLFEAKANMAMINGAPYYPGDKSFELSKLVLNKNTLNVSDIQVPELDTQYGTITCDRIELSAPLYYGDSEDVLLHGAGQYPNNALPGIGKPLLISGHDASFFAPLELIKVGDVITITTDYGTYQYAVTSKITADAKDSSAYDLTQEKEQLILYTCYPFGQLVGNRSNRFFVYCDRVEDSDIE